MHALSISMLNQKKKVKAPGPLKLTFRSRPVLSECECMCVCAWGGGGGGERGMEGIAHVGSYNTVVLSHHNIV